MPNCSKTGATQPRPISGHDCIFTRYRFACADFPFSLVSRYKVKGFQSYLIGGRVKERGN